MAETEEVLLKDMAKIKAEIQSIQLWIDDSRANRIAHIRGAKTKEKVKSLIKAHQRLSQRIKRLKGWG